jgi:hypothetical protein
MSPDGSSLLKAISSTTIKASRRQAHQIRTQCLCKMNQGHLQSAVLDLPKTNKSSANWTIDRIDYR